MDQTIKYKINYRTLTSRYETQNQTWRWLWHWIAQKWNGTKNKKIKLKSVFHSLIFLCVFFFFWIQNERTKGMKSNLNGYIHIHVAIIWKIIIYIYNVYCKELQQCREPHHHSKHTVNSQKRQISKRFQ